MPPWLLPLLYNLLIGFAFQVLAFAILPKPKGPKPDAVKDLESPSTEAGIPIPVPFGDITITGVNYLWYGEKSTVTREVKA